MRQVWRCLKCGAERQWGNIPFAQAQEVARMARQQLEDKPMLTCEKCDDVTFHVYARDEYRDGELEHVAH